MEVKHIVFLGGSHYPDFSAVGYCAFQVQKVLTADMRVSSISFRTQPHQALHETICAIQIYRIETPHMRRLNAIKLKSGKLSNLLQYAYRITGGAKRLLSPESIDRQLVKAYLLQLNKLPSKPEAIVALVFPFESVIAAIIYQRMNPSVKVIPYIFDDFVESGSLHVLDLARDLKRRRHLRLEQEMLERSTVVLSMHPLEDHFRRNFDQALVEKIAFLEHPLLVRPHWRIIKDRPNTIKMCYAGSLIKNVREPDALVDLLGEIEVNSNVQADFYVMGNASAKVPTKRLENAVQISNHGQVAKAVADAAVQHADILINLGEAQGRQVSSKIFEYMASGKPVVHFAFKENDAVTKILCKYPLAICLLMTKEKQRDNARDLSRFIFQNSRSRMSFEEVLAIFPEANPEVTASRIRNVVFDQEVTEYQQIKPYDPASRGEMT